MTFRELSDAITNLTDDQKDSDVVYVENYDDGACFFPGLNIATEDIPGLWGHAADDEDATVEVKTGMPFLQ
jgi:hypothetical protein